VWIGNEISLEGGGFAINTTEENCINQISEKKGGGIWNSKSIK
jgi:hypothetical protein